MYHNRPYRAHSVVGLRERSPQLKGFLCIILGTVMWFINFIEASDMHVQSS
jgi:hypothetical protein